MLSRMWARRSSLRRSQSGESLVEVLVSMSIMAIAIVAVMGALVTALETSRAHRSRVTAAAAVRSFAEALQGRIAQTPTGYADCAAVSAYNGIYTPPSGFTASVTTVRFWNGTTFQAGCPDIGVQQVTLQVATSDGLVSESLDVIIRKPCRVTDPPCA